MEQSAIVCSKLSLERCRNYVSHIHAVLFLCRQKGEGIDKTGAENLSRLVSLLGFEINASYDMIVPYQAANEE